MTRRTIASQGINNAQLLYHLHLELGATWWPCLNCTAQLACSGDLSCHWLTNTLSIAPSELFIMNISCSPSTVMEMPTSDQCLLNTQYALGLALTRPAASHGPL